MKNNTLNVLMLLLAMYSCSNTNHKQKTNEIETVKTSINNVFGWVVKKDFQLFYQTIANDSNFVSVTPYNRVKFTP